MKRLLRFLGSSYYGKLLSKLDEEQLLDFYEFKVLHEGTVYLTPVLYYNDQRLSRHKLNTYQVLAIMKAYYLFE